MSTFNGIVREIPNISIDRFDGFNLRSTVFFLSHCHADHMQGLFTNNFLAHLKKDNVFLYCSDLSYHILMNTPIKEVKESVKIVSFLMETIIEVLPSEHYSQPQNITVTAIPAGHCPGSIMFMFEGVCGRILYTGDIRIMEGDIKKMKQLLNCDGSAKSIETLYLDTTFLDTSYEYFPPRKNSAESLCKLISDWISQSSEHYVHIVTAAKHGSEYLFVEIFKSLKIKVHVNFDHFILYQNIPEVEPAITASSGLSQVHACGVQGEPCRFLEGKKKQGLVRTIKPSAMWFRNRQKSDDTVIESRERISFKVAYSCHSSLSELADIIEFLQPKKIVPCVIPPNANKNDFKIFLRSFHQSLKQERSLLCEMKNREEISRSEFKRLQSEEQPCNRNKPEVNKNASSPPHKTSRFNT
ncbi:hypothetical protein R5R35_000864 [Gryllus longicercus]|uniref:Protein artemis n=1 Tax=Gryllus longicercus TaxID=2509291 RepID=A0AAN9Z5T3_9ORTH